MRSFAMLAIIYAAIIGTASALVDASQRTSVEGEANGYDERSYGSDCTPDGCVPDNTRDGSLSGNSRWSCKGDILDSSDEDDGCCITYCFEEPEDIVTIRIAFFGGDRGNSLTLDVYDNGNYYGSITSSGMTLGYQSYNLYTDETEELKLCLADPQWNASVWLSITEVQIMVD